MRTNADHLTQFRNREHPIYKTDDSARMTGFFVIPLSKEDKTFALVIANEAYPDEMEWEHVSVRIGYTKYHGKMAERIPTWEEMCAIKDLFWEKSECVMQLHPPEEDYVNCHPLVLHLWRPMDGIIPRPPSIAVGPKE